jgi:cytochrome subunit of sulfide dehydrogenase
MKLRLITCSAALLPFAAFAWSTAHAQDAAYVRGMAATCTHCHGTGGRSDGMTPSLAGVDKAHMAQQMKDFKTGKRPGTIMHQLAKGYTDEQIEQMAAYFAAQKQ